MKEILVKMPEHGMAERHSMLGKDLSRPMRLDRLHRDATPGTAQETGRPPAVPDYLDEQAPTGKPAHLDAVRQ